MSISYRIAFGVDTFLICLDNKSRLYTITKYFPSIFPYTYICVRICAVVSLLSFQRIMDFQREVQIKKISFMWLVKV